MIPIIKYIDFAFKAKQGYSAPDELLSETSFSFIESFFISSFIILGIIAGGLGILAFSQGSNFALFFAILFLLVLVFDVWVFIKIKKIFKKLSKKVVDYSKNVYSETKSRIIDVE